MLPSARRDERGGVFAECEMQPGGRERRPGKNRVRRNAFAQQQRVELCDQPRRIRVRARTAIAAASIAPHTRALRSAKLLSSRRASSVSRRSSAVAPGLSPCSARQ